MIDNSKIWSFFIGCIFLNLNNFVSLVCIFDKWISVDVERMLLLDELGFVVDWFDLFLIYFLIFEDEKLDLGVLFYVLCFFEVVF